MLKNMKAYGHLKPGQRGTKRLVTKFGSALLCVRYRYDEQTDENVTTAEIVVERRPRKRTFRHHDTDIVQVAVAFTEKNLRDKLKAAGGRWAPERKVWQVQFGEIKSDPDLTSRIIQESE
ncbi:hypothetical protein L4X63_10990 [Geomonas sp. Red32]|uniref:hypothetical protein n=1 Tax=Geomonas sp. Red32 TaxID=2912856 RepID=UPI00202CF5A2|nr:hypothetical protein [Geomonas sp. Red32]MCM0082116.1 hypothetical protein [Geomonas sp. Red32]